ncbi:cupin domain-containing protein [Desulfitobacterium metallireducens]|uniref:Cupin n=1 Tax=Desulfitobacterium metallireducens DSM 15288 TaxID=871968 RepID=W0EC65_9FIRM|nr:cupin domain-containing protein [Desulfitobacterium metallireducens]AHF06789.1 cupin [Desulfitobacterium metallireducens DSM 15288]
MSIKRFENYEWENTPILNYKEEETHFKSITRRVLCEGLEDVPCQLRYFEIAPNGHSTLEHHQHAHLVIIFRGEGEVLLGDKIYPVREKDVVTIPAQTWHQFRATKGSTFGFLCLVNVDRDRPLRPTKEDINLLRQNPEVADFIRY